MRMIYLRRIGLNLLKIMPSFYKFPLLQYVEETSKIMLINEFEAIYWYYLMKKYLNALMSNGI